ncbi:diketogulonate reductase-like aldo/keto reductase [Murinocardiopsis flavida]|uniref:Diketogulonate reductase-like aldo/keto reductase n=1 Tax=Murinocardiopsis flavida TaxID=645275 RepID=A0A2P8DSU3_9ACTN|nr:aldo/keto reductase [Murinocardiopsis flavida]PSL00282.1 diketogulonate reductase-like aldo/keto reductase [Murinocardiopsis flavida]
MPLVPDVTLNNRVRMPQLGFGVWQVGNDEVVESVQTAIEAGYRNIDTAQLYGNEAGVGEAVRRSEVPREDLFITSKLANDSQGRDATLRAFDESMRRLGIDTLDLFLIHWPLPERDTYIETWKAMEKLYADGRIRAIGVSNFQVDHLTRLIAETSVIPAVNQIELHPRLTQAELRRFHKKHGIATEAWSPLGQGNLLKDPEIGAIAESYGKTPAQVILRWHLDIGNVVIPKSVTASRIRANIEVFDFELDAADVERLSELNADQRFGLHPDAVN